MNNFPLAYLYNDLNVLKHMHKILPWRFMYSILLDLFFVTNRLLNDYLLTGTKHFE